MSYTKNDIRKALLYAANKGRTTYYSDLANSYQIPKIKNNGYEKRFYYILEEIGEEELKAGRPPINSLVVKIADNLPGKRFFSWYQEQHGIKLTWKNDDLAKLAFKCQKECFDYWKNVSGLQLNKFVTTINKLYPETLKTKKPL